MNPLLNKKLATDVSLFINTSLFYMQKASPRRHQDGSHTLGALLLPRKIAGLVHDPSPSKLPSLPPQVQDAMSAWLSGPGTKHVKLGSAPLELEHTGVAHKRRLIELGMKTIAQNVPILDPSAPCVCPPVSTADHDSKMLRFSRFYGSTPAPLCANGPGGCAAMALPSAPSPLPIYLTMAEHAAAESSEAEAKAIFAETAARSLCLLCIRTESDALGLGLSEKVTNSAVELGRHVAIMPPFTNLAEVPGGYFDWAIGVNPAKTPQISIAAVVSGRPIKPNGESALVVHYDREKDSSGREIGLYVNQDAILWRPSLN